MKITAISICVGYSDFFKYCIENNLQYFDEWIVVSDTKDKLTEELCSQYPKITLIKTDIFYQGGHFRKYAGINEAIKRLINPDWVLFIDGDILISPHTRRVLEKLNLNKDKIYGIDRLNCKGFENFITFKKKYGSLLVDNWLLHSAGFDFGARIVHIYGEDLDGGAFTGWKGLGFFQLVHSSRLTNYPEGSLDASHGDIAFAKLWSRENRELIPEIIGLHIYTEHHKSQNWRGRKSGIFDYKVNTPWYIKLWDRFIIWIQSLCIPSYSGKMCCLCKIINWFRK